MPTINDGPPLCVRLSVDGLAELRDRLAVCGAAGRLRWPDQGQAPERGRFAELQVELRCWSQTLILRGVVEGAREGEPDGAWLHLPDAAAALRSAALGLGREHPRRHAEHLALVRSPRAGQVLCRVRDLGEGGARVLLSADDVDPEGGDLTVTLLDAGPGGDDLTLRARVAWTARGELGLRFVEVDEAGSLALRRLLGHADAAEQRPLAS